MRYDPGWPCGLLALSLDGTIMEVNETVLGWIGRPAGDVVGRRVHDLLSVGGRIYWETHLAPLLHVERRLDEVAVELRSPSGRMPVLLSATVAEAPVVPPEGSPGASTHQDVVRVALTSARERIRYERELRAARTAAELATARVTALQTVTAALSGALGVEGVVSALLDAAVGPLRAASATVWVEGPDGALAPAGSRGEPGAALPDTLGPLRGSRAFVDGDRVVVALRGHVALRGALSVAGATDPSADPLDLDVLSAVGQQAGLALDRARLYEHQASVARELQHSLLAVDPPDDPRFDVATLYRPGVETLDVGGDWYDVFLVEPGVLAVVVGDVVGRGLAAASAMGQLRSALRAVAGEAVGPARLLERLDWFVEQVEAASMATVAYAEVELATGFLRYACAGHPPPLLLPAGGGEGLLWAGRSTPLGAYGSADRSEGSLQLAPGDRLLLYTDGLVERRDRGLDERLAELTHAAGGTRGRPLADAVRSVAGELLRDEQGRDDVCVLLLQLT